MIITRNNVASLTDDIHKSGKTIVFTNGCFDIIHAGHVNYLSRASSYGDILFIGLNSDESVRRLKGPTRPIVPQDDRAAVLDSLKSVDIVALFDEDTPENLIHDVRPDVLIKGGDYKIEDIVGADFVQKNGGKVLTVDFLKGRSTTNIIDRIKLL